MPIENERKFMLRLNVSESIFHDAADGVEDIEQVYLFSGKKQSLRCRKITRLIRGEIELLYNMTFKQEVGKKVVEVETDIDSRDYKLLKKESTAVLQKTRYLVDGWEVDFFKADGKTYFVLAEFEMAENQKKPDSIPKLVEENLVYVVDQGDKRFTSRRLCDVKHAQRLIKSLKGKVK
jgi:CYTH domain-containing protein